MDMPAESANHFRCWTKVAAVTSAAKTWSHARCSRTTHWMSRLIVDQLEVIPTIVTDCGEAIDLHRVIDRRPGVVLIDGLAYDNPPECKNPHRWQDVEQLLNAGISVLTTVNIQYLENLQDEVERITGKQAAYIIPREFLNKSADEITVVDAPSEESVLGGIEDSSVRLAEKHKLSRLRELALLVAASVVDRQLEGYLRSQGTEQTWGVQERILVCVTAESDATEMLESGRRNADRFQGEFYVLHFRDKPLSKDQQDRLEQESSTRSRTWRFGAHIDGHGCGYGDPRVCNAARNHADLRRPQFYTARLLDTAAWQPGGPSHPSRGGNRCRRLPPQVIPRLARTPAAGAEGCTCILAMRREWERPIACLKMHSKSRGRGRTSLLDTLSPTAEKTPWLKRPVSKWCPLDPAP